MQKFERMDEAEVKHWQIIYPAYIDKNLTNKEGRRVSKKLAVE